MKEQREQIDQYFVEYGIKEWKVVESNNMMGHTITVNWVQDDIRCEKKIFKVDDAMFKLAEQFSMTRNLLKANFTKS